MQCLSVDLDFDSAHTSLSQIIESVLNRKQDKQQTMPWSAKLESATKESDPLRMRVIQVIYAFYEQLTQITHTAK
jgi:hypothetical protein